MAEAQTNGITLTPLDIQEFRDILRRDLARVRTAVGLDDTALARTGTSPDDKRRVAALRVDQYLDQLANNKTSFVGVPSFLAAQLRSRSPWSVSSAGVERVFERSSELRAMVDSLKPANSPVETSVPAASRRNNAP
jgi:hypothetical protein